jgi:hypothetical protein
MRKLLFVVILLFLGTHAHADHLVQGRVYAFHKGFINGEGFLKLSESDKASYSMGIIDGYLAAPFFGADNESVSWILSCIKGKTNTQILAIAVRYLQDNPAKWDYPAQVLMFEALGKACGK